MIPKCSNFVQEWPWDILEALLFWGSKIKVTGSISALFTLMSGAWLNSKWSQSVQTQYREWRWDILQVTWFGACVCTLWVPSSCTSAFGSMITQRFGHIFLIPLQKVTMFCLNLWLRLVLHMKLDVNNSFCLVWYSVCIYANEIGYHSSSWFWQYFICSIRYKMQ